MKLSAFENLHYGRPAAVLGGGPSLTYDVKRLPADALLIAANDHPFHAGIQPHMIVFNDLPTCKPQLLEIVKTFGGLRISQHEKYSDVVMDVDGWWRDLSSMTAAWIADFMGCHPILLCGMDCYQGEVKYCHDQPERPDKAIYKITLNQHLDHWRKAFHRVPRSRRSMRAMSGPLVDVFGEYNML